MSDKRMIFIAEKESFLVRVLVKKAQDSGITCIFVPCEIDNISVAWKGGDLVTFFMEDGINPRDEIVHYLIEHADEKDSKILLVGDVGNIDYAKQRIPQDFIYTAFQRPVNNEAFAKSIKDYYEKASLGEFKKSILIVDDDPQYLNLVRQWLKDTYKVTMANSGLQAIKFLGKNKVDLILLDHEMPVTTGPQVLEMLRSDEETRSIPVMFLTGKSDKQSVMAVVALKPEGYFLKSIQREELLEKLKEYFILHK